MNIQELSRQEYIARINRVIDYISDNLNNKLDLQLLADIASFSPFHFHRIFTMILDETPNRFVARLRLERAAVMLSNDLRVSISEIAYLCGFSSVSAFSRAFHKHYGTTAGEYRNLPKTVFVKNGIRYSKMGQPISKIGKNDQVTNPHLCSVELQKLIIMETKIEIKQLSELNLVYCRHLGAYEEIAKVYEKLFNWAGPRGLVTPQTKAVTVYHDDPNVTQIEKVRQDACITVVGDVKVEGEFGKETIPGGKYAVGRFEIPVGEEFEKAWNTICAWVMDNGFQPSGSPYELYHNQHSDDPNHKFIVDICIPVKPL